MQQFSVNIKLVILNNNYNIYNLDSCTKVIKPSFKIGDRVEIPAFINRVEIKCFTKWTREMSFNNKMTVGNTYYIHISKRFK